MKVIKKIFALFSRRERLRAYILLVLIMIQAFLEMVGVVSIMPFVLVLSNPEVIENNVYLNATYSTLGFESTQSFMFFLGIIMLLALLTTIGFKALVNYLLLRFIHMRGYSLSRLLVESYLRQPYHFFLNRHSADLGKSILSEANQVVSSVVKPLLKMISGAAVSFAIIITLFVIDPLLAGMVALGLLLGYGSIYLLVRGALRQHGELRVEANKAQFKAVQECFGGIKEVKVTGLEGPYLKRFEKPAKVFATTQARAALLKEIPKYFLQALTYGGAFLVVLYLMQQPSGLQEALPILAVFALGAQRLLPALSELYTNLSLMRFTGPALDSLHADIQKLSEADTLSRIELKNNTVAPLEVKVRIELEQVTFTYPQADKPVFKNLTLEIPAHSTIGFVGASGSGKTTIVDILMGLLKPDSGCLRIDGTVIDQSNLRAWQRNIGYVPQHIYLVDDSIAANIAFGIPYDEIDDTAVERAARIANLHDFVTQQMERGYATQVGERGVRLSGGQRQRIGIARALYHDPQVLMLDEATSALDNLTEQAVMEAVHNLGHSKTIILIAHRLSTVQSCDQILVMDKGLMVGKGSYTELMKSSPDFQAMAAN